MKSRRWVCGRLAAMIALGSVGVFAQDHGEHVVIGGHIVLLNRRSFLVLDIVHFER